MNYSEGGELLMNGEDDAVGIVDEASKARLVRTINKFLLQNGLPVTAAALRKECEKLWPTTPKKAGTEPREMPAATALPKSDEGSARARRAVHKAVAVMTATANPTINSPSPSSSAKAHAPLRPSRSRSLLATAASRRRVAGAATDAEDNAAPEPERSGKKGVESARRALSQSPPADPVRARPEPATERAPGKKPDPGKGIIESPVEGRKPEPGEWLCAHLNYAAIGQALLPGGKAGASREQALLVQALRQQLTRASSVAIGTANMRAMAAHDVLQLRNRKQSVLSLLLLPPPASSSSSSSDHPPLLVHSSSSASLTPSSASSAAVSELKDQLARLLHAVASFRVGRDYLLSVGAGRQCLYEMALALRTKRATGATAEHLLAALQKLSIRPFVQKELVLAGMMEWLCRYLVQPRLAPGALEFGAALLHNLVQCPISAQTALRHRDELLGTVQQLIGQAKSAQVLHCACGTLFALLALPRVRASARERGDTERALHDRMRAGAGGAERAQLAALLQMLRGDLDILVDSGKKRAPAAKSEDDNDDDEEGTFPDYLEADIDSTDTLVPTLSELFGQQLLMRRFLAPDAGTPPAPIRRPAGHMVHFSAPTASIEDDRESIPGVVPVPRGRARPSPGAMIGGSGQQRNKQRTARSGKSGAGGKENIIIGGGTDAGSPMAPMMTHFERTNSMSSHATFVVENNGRRPLLATSGFASVVALMKSNSAAGGGHWQQRKRPGEQQKAEENSSSSETLVISEEKGGGENKAPKTGTVGGKARGAKTPTATAASSAGSKPGATANARMFSSKKPATGKWPRRMMRSPAPIRRSAGTNTGGDDHEEEEKKQPTYDEYMSVFGARPKVARTPPTDLLFGAEMGDDDDEEEVK